VIHLRHHAPRKEEMMKRRTMAIVAATLLAAAGGSIHAQPQDPCDREPEEFRIQIRVNNNNVPEGVEMGGRDASTINACPGDTVEWHFTGRPFEIRFQGRGPFESDLAPSANGKVSGTISGTGTRGKSFKYDVAVEDGGVLDPVIIVD